jgi:polyphenol oxidase
VHGTCVIDAGQTAPEPEADAAIALNSGVVSAMLTADWLPVLLCDRESTRVAAAHAGWRGLAPGVLDAPIGALGVSRGRVEIFLSSSL